ncbi:hypothetical protein GCM10020000_30360 [Streptomyces olivoverticillatus]
MTPSEPSGNRWSDLDRPPLNATALRRGLLRPGGLWTSLDVVPRTGSTNSDLVAAGGAEGAVLVAEEQSAGRGRLDRTWSAPPRSGLFFSVRLVPGPGVPAERWGWLPLLAGVATATALSRAAGVDTALKWPNDLLVTVDGAERKNGRHPRRAQWRQRGGGHRDQRLPARRRAARADRRLPRPGRGEGRRPRPAAAGRAPLPGGVVRAVAAGRRRPCPLRAPGDLRG